MPYQTIGELPESVRAHLPAHAQEIYRAAYNSAWDEYQAADKRRDAESREEVAHKVAWAAVKHDYAKDTDSGEWQPKHA